MSETTLVYHPLEYHINCKIEKTDVEKDLIRLSYNSYFTQDYFSINKEVIKFQDVVFNIIDNSSVTKKDTAIKNNFNEFRLKIVNMFKIEFGKIASSVSSKQILELKMSKLQSILQYFNINSNKNNFQYDHNLDDLIVFKNIDIQKCINLIKIRQQNELQFTKIGENILISVNPQNQISQNKPQNQTYLNQLSQILLNLDKNIPSSIIITGESGSGKTECVKSISKLIFKNISAEKMINMVNKFQDINLILEAFGNSHTVCNQNSSRFCKLIEIEYEQDKYGVNHNVSFNNLCFLLEKTRIVGINNNENNFHVFYYYLSNFENQNQKIIANNINQNYKKNEMKYKQNELFNSLLNIGFAENEIEEIFIVLKSLIQLQELKLENDESNRSKLGPNDLYLVTILKQLLKISCNEDEIVKQILNSFKYAGNEIIISSLTIDQSKIVINSVIKQIYNIIFKYITEKINIIANPSKTTSNSQTNKIYLIDMQGFEDFEHNGFEQLLVNFANEVFQYQFAQTISLNEQSLWIKQGLDFSGSFYFPSNANIIQLIADIDQVNQLNINCNPFDNLTFNRSIFGIIEDKCLTDKGNDQVQSDASISEDINKIKSDKIIKNFNNSINFTIAHYAGDTHYNTSGFCLRNTDSNYQDLANFIFSNSSLDIIKELAKYHSENDIKTKSKKLNCQTSTISLYKNQLQELNKKLSSTQISFIRCIKPNDIQQKDQINPLKLHKQLESNGIFETVKIKSKGFAHKQNQDQFFDLIKQKMKFNEKKMQQINPNKMLQMREFMKKQINTNDSEINFSFGQDQIFINYKLDQRIKNDIKIIKEKSVTTISKMQKGQKQKIIFDQLKLCVIEIQRIQKGYKCRKILKEFKIHNKINNEIFNESKKIELKENNQEISNLSNSIDQNTINSQNKSNEIILNELIIQIKNDKQISDLEDFNCKSEIKIPKFEYQHLFQKQEKISNKNKNESLDKAKQLINNLLEKLKLKDTLQKNQSYIHFKSNYKNYQINLKPNNQQNSNQITSSSLSTTPTRSPSNLGIQDQFMNKQNECEDNIDEFQSDLEKFSIKIKFEKYLDQVHVGIQNNKKLINEMKIDLNSKNNLIYDLKKKISSMKTEYQGLENEMLATKIQIDTQTKIELENVPKNKSNIDLDNENIQESYNSLNGLKSLIKKAKEQKQIHNQDTENLSDDAQYILDFVLDQADKINIQESQKKESIQTIHTLEDMIKDLKLTKESISYKGNEEDIQGDLLLLGSRNQALESETMRLVHLKNEQWHKIQDMKIQNKKQQESQNKKYNSFIRYQDTTEVVLLDYRKMIQELIKYITEVYDILYKFQRKFKGSKVYDDQSKVWVNILEDFKRYSVIGKSLEFSINQIKERLMVGESKIKESRMLLSENDMEPLSYRDISEAFSKEQDTREQQQEND